MPPAAASALGTHGLLTQALGYVFQDLRLAATLTDGETWHPIHFVANVTLFELTHGRENQRT
ncbi:MAG TPA: hypothetical protein VGP93_05900, partial [Polyangiaceae bacterium]|nr:hypothetical protein [Polyangiaceae bacterium]